MVSEPSGSYCRTELWCRSSIAAGRRVSGAAAGFYIGSNLATTQCNDLGVAWVAEYKTTSN